MLRIAILDMNAGFANKGLACIQQICEEFSRISDAEILVKTYEVRIKAEVPTLDDFDILISSGGPGNPAKTDEIWEKKYFHLVNSVFLNNQVSTKRKYVFLICHSFQIVAQHLNFGDVTKRKSTAFGIFPVHKSKIGDDEPLFDLLPNPFFVVDSRDYQLIRPNEIVIKKFNAKILCHEKIRPHVPLERAIMAIRFSAEVFGTQFHPEADAYGMLNYFESQEKKELIQKNHGTQKYEEMVGSLADPDKIMLTESVILPTFLRNSVELLNQKSL